MSKEKSIKKPFIIWKPDVFSTKWTIWKVNYASIIKTVTIERKNMAELKEEHFLRIHRSYIVNLMHVDEVAGSHVVILKKAVPLSKSLRGKLLKRLQTF